MVVIAVIGIFSSIAVPFFNRVYRDYKVNELYDQIDGHLSSQRSYYVIMNELPRSTSHIYSGVISLPMSYFYPSSFLKAKTTVTNGSEAGNVLRALSYLKPYECAHWYRIAIGEVILYKNKKGEKYLTPSYYEDLKRRYEQLGYLVSTGDSSYAIYIDMPESFTPNYYQYQ